LPVISFWFIVFRAEFFTFLHDFYKKCAKFRKIRVFEAVSEAIDFDYF